MSETSSEIDDPGHVLYWRANIRILLLLLFIWFTASFGLGILAVDWLDHFKFLGFPLGFWVAQQGSILVFLLIIGVYAVWMNRIDRRHGVDEEEIDPGDFEI